ncbi:MAG TPA: SDR family oxidoreductase [Acidimicrobiales bacterium]|nr:SDR family oxidoreductase [Acidimicrobiales bacterium]
MLALVTGGGRGYGATTVRAFAAAGHKVAVLGRNRPDVETVAGEVDGIACIADVLDTAALERAVAAVTDAHGPVDVLVNNAGIGGSLGLAWEVEPDEWWRAVEVNVRGTHNATVAVLPSMLRRGAGRIVNVVSHAGVARWPYGSSYSVSKAAVIKYGENLAAEVRKQGVVVLNYHPGILEIGLTATLFESSPAPGTTEDMVARWFRQQIADGRSVDATESAEKLVRLASGEFDRLSGRYLTAYDDLDALRERVADIAASDLLTLGLIER